MNSENNTKWQTLQMAFNAPMTRKNVPVLPGICAATLLFLKQCEF
jgi:hypothetical protein